MSKLLQSNRVVYLFMLIFGLLVVYAFFTYTEFGKTKRHISHAYLQTQLNFLDEITTNMVQAILQSSEDKPLLERLKEDKALREHLEQELRLFQTNRYRYVYLLYQKPGEKYFRFLLDSSTKEKADFLESFQPLHLSKWHEAYRSTKPLHFINKEVDALWLTYLRPIRQNGKVVALLAIDLSLKEQHNLDNILEKLSEETGLFTLLSILIFIVVILHLFYEKKKVALLNQQAQEIQAFNETLQQRVEEEVAKNREKDKQILHQARLAQMGEMLGMIAHQWRQPLSAISSTSIEISMKTEIGILDKKATIELAKRIEELTQDLSHTIDDFRNFFKSTKEKKLTNFNEIVDATLKIVYSTLKNQNIELYTDLQSTMEFETYPSEIKQVLLNLIKNAEDVLLEKAVEDPFIKITTYDNILEVADNGGGIPEAIIEKIFDPYFSTKSLNGTGLGLYMSKAIIEEHCHGKLTVQNTKVGALFTIVLTPPRQPN